MGINIPTNGNTLIKVNWDKEAANDLKAEITRRGLTYGQVVKLLTEVGIQMTPHAFTKKVNRGGFSHAFFLQCLEILSARSTSQKNQAAIHRGHRDGSRNFRTHG